MKNKLIISCLTAILISCLLSYAVSAESKTGKCGNSADWEWNEQTKTLTISGTGDMEDYTNTKPSPWVDVSTEIEHISIENGIISVGNYAFAMCKNAAEVAISDGVTKIGDFAFAWNYSLADVILPETLNSIGTEAFVWCKNIKSVNIPMGITQLGTDAFLSCEGIEEFTVNSKNSQFCAEDGILYNIDKTALLYYPCSKTGNSFSIPSGVSSVAENAFTSNKNLKTVVFPESVNTISDKAFFECVALENVSFSEGLKTVGTSAFYNCKSLKYVKLPYGTLEIGDDAFKRCASLKSIVIPSTVKKIGEDVFYGVNGVTIYGSNASKASDYAAKSNIPFYVNTTVFMNDIEMSFDQLPIILNDTTMVPMRTIFENLGAVVEWNQEFLTATATKDGTKISIQIGNSVMQKNGANITLNSAAAIVGDRTLVPLRAISEAFDVNVQWNAEKFAVYMYK